MEGMTGRASLEMEVTKNSLPNFYKVLSIKNMVAYRLKDDRYLYLLAPADHVLKGWYRKH